MIIQWNFSDDLSDVSFSCLRVAKCFLFLQQSYVVVRGHEQWDEVARNAQFKLYRRFDGSISLNKHFGTSGNFRDKSQKDIAYIGIWSYFVPLKKHFRQEWEQSGNKNQTFISTTRSSVSMWGAHLGTKIQGRIFGRRGSGPQLGTYIDKWLVGGLEHFLFFHILGIIIPSDEVIFFRGVGIPPTRWILPLFLLMSWKIWGSKKPIEGQKSSLQLVETNRSLERVPTDINRFRLVCLSIIGLLWDWFQWKFTGQNHRLHEQKIGFQRVFHSKNCFAVDFP